MIYELQLEKGTGKKANAIVMYGHISYLGTSAVTNMERLFRDKEDFNDDISKWDVPSITTMEGMFYNATSFNQPIGAWDVHKVIITNSMIDYWHFSRLH